MRESISKIRPDSIEAKRDMSVSFIKLANCYEELNDISKAKDYLESAKIVVSDVLEYYSYGDFNDILEYIDKNLKRQKHLFS